MQKAKTVKDVMIDVFEYPHIPYWFTIRQAMGILKKGCIETDKCFHPLAVMVFDEKYNLMGTVSIRDILRGLEPKLLGPELFTEYAGADIEDALAKYESVIFDEEAKKQAELQVKEIMKPAQTFVSPDDSVSKAAFLMIHHNTSILPVLEDRKKLTGIVRLFDVYKEISNMIL